MCEKCVGVVVTKVKWSNLEEEKAIKGTKMKFVLRILGLIASVVGACIFVYNAHHSVDNQAIAVIGLIVLLFGSTVFGITFCREEEKAHNDAK